MTNHQALEALLNDVVATIVGRPDAEPRPGQVALSHDILDAMLDAGGQVVGAAPTGLGKALDVSTPIPTPSGWTTMDELRPGDAVFDEHGRVCDVIDVSPVTTDRACFEVVFSTGDTVVCDAEHLWATATRALRLQQAERRRAESRPASIRRCEQVEKLKAVRAAIESAPMHTYQEARLRLAGLADGTTISDGRKGLGGDRLARGERFDLRPVLDGIIASAAAHSALHAPATAPHEVLTAAQMRDTLVAPDGSRNHAVRVAQALDLPPADLPVDPYLLGAWLGDGSSRWGSITVGDGDLQAMRTLIESSWRGNTSVRRTGAGWTVACVRPDATKCPFGHDDWRQAQHRANRVCRTCERGGRGGERWNTGLTEDLRALGVLQNKHVPVEYLRASVQQRLALLQGLMDTDGTVSGEGRVEFCVSSEDLARGVYELAGTLGARPVIRSGPAAMTVTDPDGGRRRIDCGTRWRVGFTTDMPVFRLHRKAARLAVRTAGNATKNDHRYVVDIRPVASRPVRCIAVSSASRLFLAGRAFIPTHNSISYGVPAVLVAATAGQRTVISTESLALQAQIVDKDMPVIVDAARRLHGVAPDIAVLKGWSNYLCAKAAIATAQAAIGDPFDGKFMTEQGMARLADRVDQYVAVGAKATGVFAALLGGEGATVEIDGREVPLAELAPLVSWALRQFTTDAAGDRHSYEGRTNETTWGAVAVTPAECVGATQCPFSEMCKPAAAKRRAAEADIVVTNHSMLATQAANDLAVVVGSKMLGRFDHIVIDEAHALPGQVRAQGAKEVSGRRIMSVAKALRSVLDDHDARVKKLLEDGSAVADDVDAELAIVLGRATPKDPVVKLVEGDDPVRATGGMLETWLDRAAAMLGGATSSAHGDTEMKVRRARGRIDGLKADLKAVTDHRIGVARWVDADTRGVAAGHRAWVAAHASPVEVGGMLHANLWTAPVPFDEDAPEETEDLSIERITGKDGRPRYELSVVAVSATLPAGFAREMGMRAQAGEYPSPFEAAYGASALYVPRATDAADVSALASAYSKPGRPKFDVKAHAQWVLPRLDALVEANGGSALVLAATADAGRLYAERLRVHAQGRWEVLSQWDGNALRQTTAAWREDHHAVLVGTRSLMTGVDAPGDTCSLVVLDRIPRSPGNVVDDARVEALIKRLDTDKWSADRMVYSADAALLLEQAAGRLIRSMSDSGMVAVLDPRLLKVGPYRYQEQTRQTYMKALSRFDRKIANLGEAVAFLEGRRAGRTAA